MTATPRAEHPCGLHAVKNGSGVLENNYERHLKLHVKRQGRNWHPVRAARLSGMHQFKARPRVWNAWGKTKPLLHLRPHPP